MTPAGYAHVSYFAHRTSRIWLERRLWKRRVPILTIGILPQGEDDSSERTGSTWEFTIPEAHALALRDELLRLYPLET